MIKKTNREILVEIAELMNQYDSESSNHEAVLLIGQTALDVPTAESSHQHMIATNGKVSGIAELILAFMKNDPGVALPAIELALIRLSQIKKINFLPPLITSVFLPIRNHGKPRSKLIKPDGSRFN